MIRGPFSFGGGHVKHFTKTIVPRLPTLAA
jgi:hypothetical protein